MVSKVRGVESSVNVLREAKPEKLRKTSSEAADGSTEKLEGVLTKIEKITRDAKETVEASARVAREEFRKSEEISKKIWQGLGRC